MDCDTLSRPRRVEVPAVLRSEVMDDDDRDRCPVSASGSCRPTSRRDTVTMHHGMHGTSVGTITAWEPPRRWRVRARRVLTAGHRRAATGAGAARSSSKRGPATAAWSGSSTAASAAAATGRPPVRVERGRLGERCLEILRLYLTHFRGQPHAAAARGDRVVARAAWRRSRDLRTLEGAPAFAGTVDTEGACVADDGARRSRPRGSACWPSAARATRSTRRSRCHVFGDDAAAVRRARRTRVGRPALARS